MPIDERLARATLLDALTGRRSRRFAPGMHSSTAARSPTRARAGPSR